MTDFRKREFGVLRQQVVYDGKYVVCVRFLFEATESLHVIWLPFL